MSTCTYAMENDQNRFEEIQVYEEEGHLIVPTPDYLKERNLRHLKHDSFSHLKPTENITRMGNQNSKLAEYYETHKEAKMQDPDWKMLLIQKNLNLMYERQADATKLQELKERRLQELKEKRLLELKERRLQELQRLEEIKRAQKNSCCVS